MFVCVHVFVYVYVRKFLRGQVFVYVRTYAANMQVFSYYCLYIFSYMCVCITLFKCV